MHKKMLAMCLVFLATVAMLAGCDKECLHEAVETVNKIEATCTVAGYSGDVRCKDCGSVVEKGSTTEPAKHQVTMVGAVEATCSADGNTGTGICDICKTVIVEASVVKAKGHKEVKIGVVEATCKEKGYSGDVVCEHCAAILVSGHETDVVAHDIEAVGFKEATCTASGYSGDEVCTKCGEQVKKGKEVAKLNHTPVTKDEKAATCTTEGYSGDSYCSKCKTKLDRGKTLPATGHQRTEIRNKKAATETSEGYTGDTYCTTCNALILKGEVTPMLPVVGNLSSISALEQDILDKMNDARADAGLGSLTFDNALHRGTTIRANEYEWWLNEGGREGDPHSRPNGKKYFDVFAEIGLAGGSGVSAYSAHGEILAAATYFDGLFNAWMNSSGHRGAILRDYYTHVAISVICENNMYYACAIFHA